ncbi:putative beta chain spectrin [Operophtera brumata]|uniref:Putative beta chain spectrin n=1 Tax=Operophtera brumata TaxID=104452 RepID=A0A0L7LFP1_OPEBR|nr:putative beta chain spectrin [Operophtera brumata]
MPCVPAESAVLPSAPPRAPPQDDDADVELRSAAEQSSAWGRSRFSNGRDISAEFIQSQQLAAQAPPLPASGPPRVPERAPSLPERGPSLPERMSTITERGPNNERITTGAERVERTSSSDRPSERTRERASSQEKSVMGLVNSYQQRVSAASWSHDHRGADTTPYASSEPGQWGRRPGEWGWHATNNDHRGADTTLYASSEPGQWGRRPGEWGWHATNNYHRGADTTLYASSEPGQWGRRPEEGGGTLLTTTTGARTRRY